MDLYQYYDDLEEEQYKSFLERSVKSSEDLAVLRAKAVDEMPSFASFHVLRAINPKHWLEDMEIIFPSLKKASDREKLVRRVINYTREPDVAEFICKIADMEKTKTVLRTLLLGMGYSINPICLTTLDRLRTVKPDDKVLNEDIDSAIMAIENGNKNYLISNNPERANLILQSADDKIESLAKLGIAREIRKLQDGFTEFSNVAFGRNV